MLDVERRDMLYIAAFLPVGSCSSYAVFVYFSTELVKDKTVIYTTLSSMWLPWSSYQGLDIWFLNVLSRLLCKVCDCQVRISSVGHLCGIGNLQTCVISSRWVSRSSSVSGYYDVHSYVTFTVWLIVGLDISRVWYLEL